MRTIPRRYPHAKMLGDYRADCDYCGGTYLRREMRRTDEGKLSCREDGCPAGDGGETALTLERKNAENGRSVRIPRRTPGW